MIPHIYKELIQRNIKKNPKTQFKSGQNWREIFPMRTFRWKKLAHENMLNITNQTNANENHSEILAHTHWNSYHKKKLQILARMWRKGNTCALLVGMYICAAIVENSMEVSQKTKYRTTIWSSNSIPGYTSGKKKWKHYFEKIHAPQCSQQHYL